MADLWSDLLDCLDLRTLPDGFEGRNQQLTYHRLFGGQLLAQFVRAAELTCPGKAVKSLHTLFPRAGTSEEPVTYEVSRHHEGGTFATLTILARQSKGVIATASVSLHTQEDGPAHQSADPVPELPGAEHRQPLDLLPWETRGLTDLNSRAASRPEFDLWMRTPEVPAELGPALAAYATDLTLIGTALLALDGVSQLDAGKAFTSAVTGHTIWFHRPFRTDEWFLLHQHGPLLARARTFGRGDILTEDGSLVASYAQEALLRLNQ